jgi:hypothetical protein
MDGSSAITGALLQRELALSELAKHRFVILKLQFAPLSLDIYHPLVGLVVGLVRLGIICMASMSPKLLCCGMPKFLNELTEGDESLLAN